MTGWASNNVGSAAHVQRAWHRQGACANISDIVILSPGRRMSAGSMSHVMAFPWQINNAAEFECAAFGGFICHGLCAAEVVWKAVTSADTNKVFIHYILETGC